jgi:hypothetical protein
MCRPACLIIHTGTRSVFSPRAARIRRGSIVFPDESTFVWGIGVAFGIGVVAFGAVVGGADGWAEKEWARGAVEAAATMARRAEENFIVYVSLSSLFYILLYICLFWGRRVWDENALFCAAKSDEALLGRPGV